MKKKQKKALDDVSRSKKMFWAFQARKNNN